MSMSVYAFNLPLLIQVAGLAVVLVSTLLPLLYVHENDQNLMPRSVHFPDFGLQPTLSPTCCLSGPTVMESFSLPLGCLFAERGIT